MPEGVGYGPQFTASTGLTLNYIGKHCYAYSGSKASSGTKTNFLEFTTGKHYIRAKFQPIYFAEGTNNVSWVIKFNGQSIQSTEVTSARDYTPFQEILLLIPPLTFVEVEVDNLSGGTEAVGAAITGKVYE
jgi:hypothetical protein